MKTNSRRLAIHALQMIDKLQKIISDIDNGASINHHFDSIEYTTVKLGNAVKEISKLDSHAIGENIGKSLYDLRCRFAHRNGAEKHNPNKDYELWNNKIKSVLPALDSDLRKIAKKPSKNFKKREFESRANNILGNPDKRKRIVDAIEDSFNNNQNDTNCEYPDGSEIVKQTADTFDAKYKDYLLNHGELSEDVQTEILNWSEKTKNDVEYESLTHFAAEESIINKINKLSPSEFFNNTTQFESDYNSIESVPEKFDMLSYLKSCNDDVENITATNDRNKQIALIKETYFHALKKALQKSFNDRKAEYEQNLIDARRKQFLKELYERIEYFKKIEDLLSPLVNDLGHGYLWDLSSSPFKNHGFDILKKYSMLLNNDKALQEFAELLGRQSTTTKEIERRVIEETIVKSSYTPKTAQSGIVVGFTYSNDISKVIPSEKSLMLDPDIEDLFYLKFAEKRLLSYRYANSTSCLHSEKRQHEYKTTITKDASGPIIICVDTSGSMHGTPEQTAKVATLAIAKSAFKHHRKCFLISFSTNIETLDLSDFHKIDALDTLVQFLNKSFYGGTDASPALQESLKQLETESYKNADVLMISDFVMNRLPQELVSSMEKEQNNGTRFYSIIIGNSANNASIKYFNEVFNYNPYNEHSRREFSQRVRELSIRRK